MSWIEKDPERDKEIFAGFMILGLMVLGCLAFYGLIRLGSCIYML